MEPVEYDETIHPVVWLNKIKSCCYKNQITKKEDIMEFCKSMIHPSIDVSKSKKIKSLNDLIVYFNQSFLKRRKLIRSGSCISLKHVATGKYLTSCNMHYKTGSKGSIFNVFNVKIISIKVFASQTLSNLNSLWIVSDFENESNPIVYGKNKVYFLNKGVNENIFISGDYKSPSTGNWEVSCTREIYEHLIESDSTNNNDTYYIKSKEIINIRDMETNNCILHSHEFPFTIDNETYQEVVGHKGRVDRNDKADTKRIPRKSKKSDWVIKIGDTIIVVTEAKREDINQGVGQNAIQLQASSQRNKKKRTFNEALREDIMYGIVSTGVDWVIIKLVNTGECNDNDNGNVEMITDLPLGLLCISYGRRPHDRVAS
ncbi:hypothetical protein GLOIN_2v1469723 [Rhizophagus irregularis DAOM 181602=DAOM 197198]|uniref:MIR domain-containing protein n=1 Tax=Rhizophagus irregularis (strain DAOM 181602 / DAOM 197198 / MUCL 43194) TaxID=747089 RepID=A0A2P4QZ34_RHIID|nr:hypothetical protein GLOIN_2v1469723 [Rhizophagus irregularis DAOM 181602=DAOM 197198]POG82865.1 hypothetical protein GLOIN_2v1469723 [Rhizophagus irregularis DAOM 181602=DAOM 197198]|eukprot:XP_025189731.1 hypothetical protein GLOIN_2v1469723 [Rhizophagus irregularis DAOM 181602=DAOM 197198]